MTKPTPEQIQRACDRVNAILASPITRPSDYGESSLFTALADTIAELDAEKARTDKAVADLREIDRLLAPDPITLLSAIQAAHIAARHRVETDLLVEALEATGDDEAVARAWRLRAQLLDRGYEIAKRGIEV